MGVGSEVKVGVVVWRGNLVGRRKGASGRGLWRLEVEEGVEGEVEEDLDL